MSWEEGRAAAATLGFTVQATEAHGVLSGRHVWLRLDGTSGSGQAVVSARLDPPLDLGLKMYRRQVLLGTSNKARTGSADLDMVFSVEGDEPHRIEELFEADLCERIVTLHRASYDVRLNDGGCTISAQPAASLGAAWLVNAARAAARIVALVDDARAEVRAAAPLARHVKALRAIAAARGLAFASTPLSLTGRSEGRSIAVSSARTGRGHHHLRAQVSFETELGLGLTVRHRRFLDSVWTLIGGQDLSDSRRHFFVRARPQQADRARAVLDRRVYAALLALDERAGPLTIDDRGVTVDPIPASVAPEVVVWTIDTLDEARARIEHNLLHGSAGGPYR